MSNPLVAREIADPTVPYLDIHCINYEDTFEGKCYNTCNLYDIISSQGK